METNPYLTKKPCKNLSPKTSVKNTVLFFIIISFLLPACSKKMSLEEAKEVSISISGKSFVPPPRRIDDITKILDEKPPDSTTVENLQSTADSVPSAGASTVELQEFYYQRGIAAATLGRYKQSLMDLRQAVSLFGDFSSRTPTIHKMIIDSALAEARVNNFRAGIEFAERMRTKFPNWAGVNNLLVSLYALAGDLESAEKARDRALEIMSKWRDSSNNNIWRRYNSAGDEGCNIRGRRPLPGSRIFAKNSTQAQHDCHGKIRIPQTPHFMPSLVGNKSNGTEPLGRSGGGGTTGIVRRHKYVWQ